METFLNKRLDAVATEIRDVINKYHYTLEEELKNSGKYHRIAWDYECTDPVQFDFIDPNDHENHVIVRLNKIKFDKDENCIKVYDTIAHDWIDYSTLDDETCVLLGNYIIW